MNRAVFLDRDGVVNEMVYNPDHGTVDSPCNPEEFRLLPGVGEAIRTLNKMRFLVLVMSNQPGIAKGKFTTQILEAVNDKMLNELKGFGAHVDGIYYCLHHPHAVVKKYRENCNCRKPKPGLFLRAIQDFSISPYRSYLIGDGFTDVQPGKIVGCKTIFLGRLKCYICNKI